MATAKTKPLAVVDEEAEQQKRNGFILPDGGYVPWSIRDTVKDIILVDKVTGGMPTAAFYAAVYGDDPEARGRGVILVGMIACSIRQERGWTVERTAAYVMDLEINDVEFIAPPEVEPETKPEGPEGEIVEPDPPESS